MKHVLLLLANGFEAYEAAVFTDVLGWADAFGDEKIRVVTAGLHQVLRCAFGLTVVPDILVKDIVADGFDALAIPGGFGTAGFYADAFSEEFLNVIRRFHEVKKPVAAVCVAALSLGRSGILKARPATTYRMERRKLEQLASLGALVQDENIVKDGHLITSSSPGTAVEVAFMLLTMLTSEKNSLHVRRLMGFA